MELHHRGSTIEAGALPVEDETTWLTRTVVSWRQPDGRLRQWLGLREPVAFHEAGAARLFALHIGKAWVEGRAGAAAAAGS
jgi:hypothetical protein